MARVKVDYEKQEVKIIIVENLKLVRQVKFGSFRLYRTSKFFK